MRFRKYLRLTAPVIAGLFLICGSTRAGNVNLDASISVSLEGMPLHQALNMIAGQYDLNMVIAGSSDAKVSLFLQDVTLKDALDALLLPNGFTHYRKGDVLVVSPATEAGSGGMETFYYRLKFATAKTAQNAVKPILSEHGKVELVAPDDEGEREPAISASALLIRDFPSVIEQARNLLAQLDVSERMIMIEVKMVETKIDTKDILGINWPKSVALNLRQPLATTSTTASTVNTQAATAASIDLPHGRLEWGTLSADELNATLDFLQSSGKSTLISNPRLSTLENHKAEFKVATVVPVQTINRFSEGSSTSDIVTFQDIEVGITLEVKPRINEEGVITMDVFPSVAEIIGFSGTADQQKPITTERSVRTVVTCKQGETVVIGGLLRENEITSEDKIPLLGDIPLLGGLFRHKRTETENTDLLIMITPTAM